MAEEISMEVFANGLTRIDRVLDDSGFAFTALDVNVRFRSAFVGCNLVEGGS
jgi:hypothetical protein